MIKKINLARVMRENTKCIGYCWQMRRGKYEYQNDNDLGLDLEAIDCLLPYTKKVYVGSGYYFYVMRGIWGEDSNTATTLKMVAILLKQCHSRLFKLTSREQKRADKYWGQF